MFLQVALLFQAITNPAFTQVDHPGAVPDLKARLAVACASVPRGDRETLLRNELRLASAAHGGSVSADTWWSLGCARALLWVDGAIAHDGPLMISGNSWAQGSAHAMLEALKQRPTDARAANVLALLSLDQAEPDPLKEIAAALIGAVRKGVDAPAVLRACSEYGFRVGSPSDTYFCARKALSAGMDSTWHLLRLARLGFRDHDTVGSSILFSRAASAAHDSITRLEIDWHLQWFLSPDERTQWGKLADSARGSFVIDRLASRDVRDGQPAGARLAEHFARLEYVETHFRLRVPRIIKKQMLTGVSTVASDTTSLAFRNYNRWQVDFDDQGVIWMRFGEPEKTALDTSLAARETWRYTIDGQTMIVSFYDEDNDGSVGASKVSVGMLGTYMCSVDTWRCMLAMMQEAHTLGPADVERLREQDAEYITVATQKDDNSVRDDAKNLRIVSNLHRLWDPISSAPMSLVTWALRLDDLAIRDTESVRTAVVDLDLRRWDPSANAWSDTSFARHLIIPDKNSKRSSVTGFIITPSTAGVTSWSLVATQPERRGRAWDDGAPLGTGPLALSDLVLGAESEGLVWNNRGAPIALAPLDAVDRKETVQLYYQVKSRIERPQLKTTIALYRLDDPKRATEPVLQVTYADGVHEGLNEIAPTLDVSRLEKGSYRLEVRIEDEDHNVTATRSARLNLD